MKMKARVLIAFSQPLRQDPRWLAICFGNSGINHKLTPRTDSAPISLISSSCLEPSLYVIHNEPKMKMKARVLIAFSQPLRQDPRCSHSRSALASWPVMFQEIVVGALSLACSKVTVPATLAPKMKMKARVLIAFSQPLRQDPRCSH
jgi:hypothetical protein